jgi:hydrogenase maturation protein HypF
MSSVVQTSRAIEVRLRGRVQGVGFRPLLWRLARELGLAGEVLNDGEGVLLRVGGEPARIAALVERITRELPPLARVDAIETRAYDGVLAREFCIIESASGPVRTEVAPDAALCVACAVELRHRGNRHFVYPFTSCTHCGPRLTIVTAVPYDRARTSMAPFALCPDCAAEYGDPCNRRFHAEAIACPACGPRASLIELGARARPLDGTADAVGLAADLVRSGAIIAIKGIGGYHLCCDATHAAVVARLRARKQRQTKPFALMARDLDVIRCYCTVSNEEQRALTSARAPIVLLEADGAERLPQAVSPGLTTLGFMLPTTPLHFLLFSDIGVPLVMTSGNIADEPPIIDDGKVREQLAGIADYALIHDREIANRVDDSVVRLMGGKCRALRRARGFAPEAIRLPAGFATAPSLTALGGEQKSTFCLLQHGKAILSQHQGDLENAATFDDYRKNIALFNRLFAHEPTALVIDRHPEYLSSKFGKAEAEKNGLPLLEVQHHHAHIAACLAENGHLLDGPPVLGIVLDGLGLGDDDTIWGGEFLLADYRGYRRLARLKPVTMPGGAQAVREPWRNLYAHLAAAIGFDAVNQAFGELEATTYLKEKPRHLIESLIAKRLNAPLASSCGRLFDAVAAAIGVCRERQGYEGEAAIGLETLAQSARGEAAAPYPFALSRNAQQNLIEIDPAPMWGALLRDLKEHVTAPAIALKFHYGLTEVLVETTRKLAGSETAPEFVAIVLSGGCFQNRILFETAAEKLRAAGFAVLAQAEVPANDGGLALGQAVIGAARLLAARVTAE